MKWTQKAPSVSVSNGKHKRARRSRDTRRVVDIKTESQSNAAFLSLSVFEDPVDLFGKTLLEMSTVSTNQGSRVYIQGRSHMLKSENI